MDKTEDLAERADSNNRSFDAKNVSLNDFFNYMNVFLECELAEAPNFATGF
jgi:hypothetical protein